MCCIKRKQRADTSGTTARRGTPHASRSFAYVAAMAARRPCASVLVGALSWRLFQVRAASWSLLRTRVSSLTDRMCGNAFSTIDHVWRSV
jgi:hypothetical protein